MLKWCYRSVAAEVLYSELAAIDWGVSGILSRNVVTVLLGVVTVLLGVVRCCYSVVTVLLGVVTVLLGVVRCC